ncbi:pseudouridine synthase [Tengunoibacter tsumagoiensis]|uniref:Pseudouridine synthase n=1 Tax=Tengunoibacter tsumagoiensis TaxID=2014871 RepID=A0A402A5E7_9CHLR|nr:pseudouridine synthase [Tengunoibacter tsumagoiensis]GCE14364.1 pseudouridine synthase [Tengunoibacter tsumagoiensis]
MSEQNNGVSEERLARFLAHAGVASRRHAEELISAGRVEVNGVTVTQQGSRINPESDQVRVDGKLITSGTKQVYLLLHKPAGYVSTASDPEGRPTVLDLLPAELRQLRVYPVGRLDRDTSGLLLLTNDGQFALRLSHPRYSMEKHYEARVQGCPDGRALAALEQGVDIVEDDGGRHHTSPARVRILKRNEQDSWLALTIHEGRKRQVRRMLQAVGYPVLQLSRVGVGPLTLNNVPTGKWRYLTDAEVQHLLQAGEA